MTEKQVMTRKHYKDFKYIIDNGSPSDVELVLTALTQFRVDINSFKYTTILMRRHVDRADIYTDISDTTSDIRFLFYREVKKRIHVPRLSQFSIRYNELIYNFELEKSNYCNIYREVYQIIKDFRLDKIFPNTREIIDNEPRPRDIQIIEHYS